MTMTRRSIFICSLAAVLLIAACSPGSGHWSPENKAGFWAGMWHGMLLPYMLISGLFAPPLRITEPNNVGFGYTLGFVAGVGVEGVATGIIGTWWGYLLLVLFELLESLPRSFRRAFSRVDGTPVERRPTGYGWGWVFVAVNGLAGLVYGILAVSILAAGPPGAPEGPQLLLELLAGVLSAVVAAILLLTAVCAAVRRYAVCYLTVIVGLAASIGLSPASAVLKALQGKWLDAVLAFLYIGLYVAWIVYFGNRRHMFGYLRGPSEQRDVVQG